MMLTGKVTTPIQDAYVGAVVEQDITIIDIAQTAGGDTFVLCFNLPNKIHRFVTWGIDPKNLSHRWAGHYCFTLEEALEDFNSRVGRKTELPENG